MTTGLPPTEELTVREGRFARASEPSAAPIDEVLADPEVPTDEVAEVHRLRRRMVRDLEALAEHVERLSTRIEEPPPAAPQVDVAAVMDKLVTIRRHLDEAQTARIAVMDAQAVQAHQTQVVFEEQRARSDWRRRAVAGAAGLTLLGAGVAGGTLLGGSDDASVPAARTPAPPAAAAVVPCGDGVTGTCTTGTLLTIAEPGAVLNLDGAQLRALSSDLSGDELDVRLRLASDTPRSFAGARDLYLALGGQRIHPVPGTSAVDVRPGPSVSVTRTFRLGAKSQAALRRASNRVDLGVVPGGTDRRVGVLRLVVR